MIDLDYRYRQYVAPFLRDPKKRAYSLLGMTLVALIIFGALAIRPALTTVISLRKQVVDLRETDQLLNEKIIALTTAQGTYKTAKQNLYLLDVALPNEPEIPEIVDKLNAIAGKSKINLKSLSVERSQGNTETLQKTRLRTSFSGSFVEITQFTSLIESDLRQMEIGNMQIRRRSDDPEGILDTTMVLETYYVEEKSK